MSDAETYGHIGAAFLTHPRDTVEEALSEYVGDGEGLGDEVLDRYDAQVRAEAIREYVTAARENPHTQYWPASGVLDDAEQWADEIERGTI